MTASQAAAIGAAPAASRLGPLTLAALGVVYGDIGTSPLYTVKECFGAATGLKPVPEDVLGILSLITWALVGVVTLKYIVLLMRADNRGEGGILALMALVSSSESIATRRRRLYIVLGIAGAALFYGDCILTPAISVLSAVEGLKVATSSLDHYIEPITVGVIVALFAIQRFGTGGVGAFFGPITALWFLCLLVLGLVEIAHNPAVLQALNPVHGIDFFLRHGLIGFLALGAVVLAITGAEALYADMGHFGPRPIRLAWLALVLPSLMANYYGQGALILRDPAALENPFYLLVPSWGLYPMVGLATIATVIASQAVISGAYSMAQQAALLGLTPRLRILHTSESAFGQIYVPAVNWLLLAGVVALVLEFKTSSALASAYGIAVTGTMLITTVLAAALARAVWKWSWPQTIAVVGTFAIVDATLFSANLEKVPTGGWIPLALGAVVFITMWTWLRGREVVVRKEQDDALPLDLFLNRVEPGKLHRAPGTAVFMTSLQNEAPRSLLHNLKHNNVLHERVLLVSVRVLDQPHVPDNERLVLHNVGKGLQRVVVQYGFMQTPDVPRDLARLQERGLPWDAMRTSYFVGQNRFVPTAQTVLPRWQEKLFLLLSRSSSNAADFFQLPNNQVIELGGRIEV